MTNEELARRLHDSLAPLDIVPLDAEFNVGCEPSIGGLRRRRASRFEDPVGVMTLLDIDGVLVWEEGAVSPMTSTTRRRRGGTAAGGTVVTQLKYVKELGTNRIGERLTKLDRQLTPQGPGSLLKWNTADWTSTPCSEPAGSDKTLLFIHGTFSNGTNLIGELWGHDGEAGNAVGAGFLRKVASHYSEVLSFEHDTLSRSPLVNALDLSRLFAKVKPEQLDVICHSRGGLVARWWCEVLDRQTRLQRRVIFVGCPLQGTSLADPTSLRNGLNLLSNVGRTLGSACRLVPFLTAAAGLMQILNSVTSVAARTPVVDAGLAMIPGLAAMSRITNNHELNTLNESPPPPEAKYFAVISDFEPDPVSWRFWRLFSKGRLADAAADYLVFEQPNDLVVDVSSMSYCAFGPSPDLTDAKRFCTFGPQEQIHHTNYFSSKRTIDFLESSLGL